MIFWFYIQWGDTALIHATSRSAEKFVDSLLERNADVNWKGRVMSQHVFMYVYVIWVYYIPVYKKFRVLQLCI